MNRIEPRTRFAAFLLLIALLACAFVAVSRFRIEQQSRNVEIAMDYSDFLAFARSYNYNPADFLIALRRAGLTSLALSEQLGGSLTGGGTASATAISGLGLLNQARLAPVANPTLAALVRSGNVRAGSVYIVVYDRATFERYMQQLPLHFERSSITVLHSRLPYVIAVRTQIDYFNSTALGIPADQIQLAMRLHLFVIPRFQNDERLRDGQIAQMFADLHAGNRVSDVVFFGLRNQVLGFPDHLKDTAAVFRAHKYMNYGEIETYDASQVQKGNVGLARMISGHIVRVQAISKTELDKLTVPQIIARYELGVRERNVRVVYLRPFGHQYNGLSIEKTNVELVSELAQDLRSHGFTVGPPRASPIRPYHGNSPVIVGIAALAVPSLFVLLLGVFGWYRPSWAVLAYALTELLYIGGYFTHHDIVARSVIAVCGTALFAAAAFLAFAPAFSQTPERRTASQFILSLRWTLVATGIALLGALVVVGVASSPLTMEEVEPLRGVKLVLALPPLIALALYLFTDRYDSGVRNAREAFAAPVRIYQLLIAAVVLGAGALMLMRSGNTSDIAPSSFELSLRHHLTELLSVRPRFKEFVIGFPFMMLVPALRRSDRRASGIILSLAVGVGIGDVMDTFSHLHTPLSISITRVLLGLILGAIIGAIVIAIYRRIDRARTPDVLIAEPPAEDLLTV